MPMGSAWKESTSNSPRSPPPNRDAVALPLLCHFSSTSDISQNMDEMLLDRTLDGESSDKGTPL